MPPPQLQSKPKETAQRLQTVSNEQEATRRPLNSRICRSVDGHGAQHLKGPDFHFIPEQLAWQNKSPTHLKDSVIITKYSNTCYLHLASTGRNHSTARSNDLPKGRANSIADLFIELGIPARDPSIHLRSLKPRCLSLLREPPELQMRRKENSKSKYTKQKFRLPSGTAPFLHLLECHCCILKPQLKTSVIHNGEGKRHR